MSMIVLKIENYMNWRGLGIKIMAGLLKMGKVRKNGRVIKWSKMVGKDKRSRLGMVKKGQLSENAKERQRQLTVEVAKCGGKLKPNTGVDKQQKSKMIIFTIILATKKQ